MSQDDLVKKSGISRDVISRIENGKNISLDSLIMIAKALGIESWTLLTTKEKRESFEAFIEELSTKSDIQKRLSKIEEKIGLK